MPAAYRRRITEVDVFSIRSGSQQTAAHASRRSWARWPVLASVVSVALHSFGCRAANITAPAAVATSVPPTRKAPEFRYLDSRRGCADLVVEKFSADRLEQIVVSARRDRLGLSTEPKAFRIEERPSDLNVYVNVYPPPGGRDLPYPYCTDVVYPGPRPTTWRAIGGRASIVISKDNPRASPVPAECYQADVVLEDVVFASPLELRWAQLERLSFENVTVGDRPPVYCRP
jgi:hypothetical protein